MQSKGKYLEFINSVKPLKSFKEEIPPPEIDYLKKDSWAAFPGVEGFHNLSPDISSPNELKKFDVFYIHPTGFFGTKWNEDIDSESASFERTGSHMATQASVFSQTCNVYAPQYRQATYYSFFDLEGNGEAAQDLAYQDLSKAFKTYLRKYNKGRPFFVAGHSQGALHGQRLVHEHISNQSIKELFISAYLIGYILPLKHFDDLYPDLKISRSPKDVQTIISWCTGIEGFQRNKAHSMFWTPDGWCREVMEQPLVCQNPMTWTVDKNWQTNNDNIPIRLKSTNLFLTDYHSTKHTHSKLSIEKIDKLSFQSRYSKNFMIETKGSLIDKMKSFTIGGDLHNFDMTLFWGSIRKNVQDRANAYSK